MAKQTKKQNGAATVFMTVVVIFLVLACVGVAVVGYYSKGFQNWEKFGITENAPSDSDAAVSPGEIMQTAFENSENVRLMASPAFSSADGATVSKTLTATVLPEDAPDKSVDWSVMWVVPISEDAVVTDYVTVTPQSDGSNVATVTCHQEFEGGVIHVVCTTRVGGFEAICRVSYDGVPEVLRMMYEGENTTMEELEVLAGQSYSVELQLSNTLGAVGSKYGDYEIVSFRMQGRFNARKEYIVNGTVQKSEDFVINLEDPSFTLYGDGGIGTGATVTISPSEFASVTLEGNTIQIQAHYNEQSYSYPSVYPRTGTRVRFVGEYYDPRGGGVPEDCRLVLSVREKVSGLTAMMYIDVISTVTSVSVDSSEITF